MSFTIKSFNFLFIELQAKNIYPTILLNRGESFKFHKYGYELNKIMQGIEA